MSERPLKVSGFTFLRNAQRLGYPFLQSIRSILPIVDEYVIALGPCSDDTEGMLRELNDEKIKIIRTQWNERMLTRGFVYGQQKSIALFNCTGDWAFYLEADEVVHEGDLPAIKGAMEKYVDDNRVEALVFDYIHFYGNKDTYLWSPGWYRKGVRIIKNSIRSWAPDGLFFIVLESNKRGRYPKAVSANATIYHYGWVRSESQMNEKVSSVSKYWGGQTERVDYSQTDSAILRRFKGTHPLVMNDWLPQGKGAVFQANPDHVLTKREKKHRMMLWLERVFRVDLSKKHFKLVR